MKKIALFITISFFAFVAPSSYAQTLPVRPAVGEYVIDNANVIDPRTKEQIRKIANNLWEDKGITLYIITIKALEEYDASNMNVPEYAKFLYNNWVNNDDLKNEKIMLLFSLEDDYMQIMLKSGWRKKYGRDSHKVFDNMIAPLFYEDRYAEALLAGAVGLDEMARKRRFTKEEIAYGISFLFLMIVTMFLASRRKVDRR